MYDNFVIQTSRSLAPQIRSVLPAVGLILTITFLVLAATLLLRSWQEIPLGHLTEDPARVVGFPFYIGFLSNIGIMFWSATVAICLFSATLVRQQNGLWFKPFLYASGCLTLLLTLDDLFLLHERVFPNYVGLSEEFVLAGYVMLMLLYLFKFSTVIFKTEYLLLGLALCFFGISVVVDILPISQYVSLPVRVALLEDGAKFAGIVSWLVYFTRVSALALQHRVG